MSQFEVISKATCKPFSNNLENPDIISFVKKILADDKSFFYTTIVYSLAIAILSLALPVSIQLLINSVAFTAMFQPILVLGIVLLLLLSFSSTLKALQIYVLEIFQRRFFAKMTADMTMSIINASHKNFEQANQTEFVNRFFEVMNVQKIIPKILIKTFTLILQTIAGLILVAFYHPLLLVFSLIIISIIFVIWYLFAKSGFASKFNASKKKYEMASWIEDMARNNILFKSEVGQKYAIFKTDFLTSQYINERKNHFKYAFTQISLMLGLYTIASAMLLIIGGYLVVNGQLSIGQLVASELVLSATLYGISELGRDFENFYEIASASEKLSQFYNITQEESFSEKITEDKLKVKFENVIDNYFGREFHFDMTLEPRKNYLVSTANLTYQKILIELIYGLRKPMRGSLQFNDIDIENINLSNLRSNIAIIDNSSFIEGTVLEYLTFNNKDINKKFLNETIFITGLDKILSRFKEGLNLRLNPSGYPLSESEKIILKIAHHLLQNPKIIIITEVLDMVGLKTRREILKFLTKDHQAMVLYFSNRRDDMLDFDEYLFIDEHKIHHFKSIEELDEFEQKNG